MKIKKIYISAFGKLKDYTLDLTDGLNVIYGENEQGKSTIMAFVKMMFYGSGRGSSQISKNLRLKYTPWSNERAAGRIFFEHSGTNYCLEREFMRSDSTDKVRLTNNDTGETKAVGSDIGTEFFSLTSAAFDRTVFIGQFGIMAKDEEANGEINSKLSNIVLTGDEDISFQTVFKRLNDAKLKLMSKSGKAGKFDKGKATLLELKSRLTAAEENEQRKEELNRRIKEIKSQTIALSEEYANLKKTVDSQKDIQNRQKLEEFLSTKAELDRIKSENTLSNGALPDETFVKKIEFCLSRTEAAQQRVTDCEAEIDRLKNSIALAESTNKKDIEKELSELQNALYSYKKRLNLLDSEIRESEEKIKDKAKEKELIKSIKRPFSPILLILGALFAALGIVLAISNAIIGSTISVIGAILFILSFILKPKANGTEAIDNEILSLQSIIAEKKSDSADLSRSVLSYTEKLNEMHASLNADKAVIAERKAELEVRLNRLNEEKYKLQETEEELFKITELYKNADSVDSVKSLLPELNSTADRQKQLKLKLKYLSDDLGSISYEEAKQKLDAMADNTLPSDTDFKKKREELDSVNEKITSLKEEYSAITAELKTAFKNFVEPKEIRAEIEEITKELDCQKYFCDTVDIATEVLESSFIEVRRSFGSALEKKALEIFSRLTDGKYANVNISKSMDITVEETDNFGTREVEYLSNGTVDQAYLSLRLALSELISENENLPVLLDDVFCQYDDKRTKTAMEFLKEYSSASQALLFTCHNSICDISEKLGIDIKRL